MIAAEAVGTLGDALDLERIEKLAVRAQAAYVALLAAQLAARDVLDDGVDAVAQLLVVLGALDLVDDLDRVDVLIVDEEVVEVGVELLVECDGEATRAYVGAAVVQLGAEHLDARERTRLGGEQGRIEALERDERLAVDLVEEALGLLAHRPLAEVERGDHVRRYVRLLADVAAAAEVLAEVLAVVERLELVGHELDAAVGAAEVLLLDLLEARHRLVATATATAAAATAAAAAAAAAVQRGEQVRRR